MTASSTAASSFKGGGLAVCAGARLSCARQDNPESKKVFGSSCVSIESCSGVVHSRFRFGPVINLLRIARPPSSHFFLNCFERLLPSRRRPVQASRLPRISLLNRAKVSRLALESMKDGDREFRTEQDEEDKQADPEVINRLVRANSYQLENWRDTR
jgi:hypothetical protein